MAERDCRRVPAGRRPTRPRATASSPTSTPTCWWRPGAGSGKTTAMVGRMVELIRTGTATVDQIAAVTFTRKAAGELRERFQEELEEAFARPAGRAAGAGPSAPAGAPLSGIDRCFVGTIHSFCGAAAAGAAAGGGRVARLRGDLRARGGPAARGGWSALPGAARQPASSRLAAAARRAAASAPRSSRGALPPGERQPGRALPASAAAPRGRMEIRPGARRRWSRCWSAPRRGCPADEPEKGWDELQTQCATLAVLALPSRAGTTTRASSSALAHALGHEQPNRTQNRWGSDRRRRRRRRRWRSAWDDFCAEEGRRAAAPRPLARPPLPAGAPLRAGGRGSYAAERQRDGAAQLPGPAAAHRPPAARAAGGAARAGARATATSLVDEFQDTDPLQAEVVFLLASEPASEAHWSARDAAPRRALRRGRPQAEHLPLPPRRHLRLQPGEARFRRVRRRARAHRQLPLHPPRRALRRTGSSAEPLPEEEIAAPGGLRAAGGEARGEGARQGVCVVRLRAGGGPRRLHRGAHLAAPRASSSPPGSRERITERGACGGRLHGPHPHEARARGLRPGAGGARRPRPGHRRGRGRGGGAGGADPAAARALRSRRRRCSRWRCWRGSSSGSRTRSCYAHVARGGVFAFPRDDPPGRARRPRRPLHELRALLAPRPRLPPTSPCRRSWRSSGILPHAVAGELGGTRAGALLYALDALRTAALRRRTARSRRR